MSAQWSRKRHDEEIAQRSRAVQDRIASVVAERAELFKRFRAADWQISVLDPDTVDLVKRPDTHPETVVNFLVKMPGAAPARIRSFVALLRLARGVA